jgi:hypothetical protein
MSNYLIHKLMRKQYLSIVLMIMTCYVCAQNKTCYFYDDAGNRTIRTICLKSTMATIDSTRQIQPIIDKAGDLTIALYPNPTKGLLTIQVTNLPTDAQGEIALCDITGKQLMVQKTIRKSNIIDLSMRPTGVYILRIRAGDKVSEWKVVKE